MFRSMGTGTGTKPPAMTTERYEFGPLVGEGNFAKVYLGRHRATGEEVAIKVMDKEKLVRLGATELIKREIAVMQRLRHPNVVRIHEVMVNKRRICVVMEYVRGGALYRYFRRGPSGGAAGLREHEARRFFQQLVSAVAYCHSRGVFHRDIKLDNLLVDEQGNLKVADFGLSALADMERREAHLQTVCGTPLFLAPEVFKRRGYDGAKADVWACGVVLYVLLTGRKPFPDEHVSRLYRLIGQNQFQCPPSFSPDLARLVRRLLQPDPDRRITIPEIMEMRWFKRGFKEVTYYIDSNDRLRSLDGLDGEPELYDSDTDTIESSSSSESPTPVAGTPRGMHTSVSAPALSELDRMEDSASLPLPLPLPPRPRMPRPKSLNAFDIIASSPSFDLSGLFEERGERMRFVSGAPVADIIAKLQEIAGMVSFTARTKDCQVSIEATRNGQKGALAISAKVFELTRELVMVQVCKKAGDTAEYRRFCDNELKAGLRGLVVDALPPPVEGGGHGGAAAAAEAE
uniref:non-specific serine/threonine protein kinase n=1 Tax=Oryza sativa subsp. japonica TaxID=39947 RepID=C8CBI1_ORYSJ|nr:CBL-interacting protein kinase 25 [Oryza sativa Japonica Group]